MDGVMAAFSNEFPEFPKFFEHIDIVAQPDKFHSPRKGNFSEVTCTLGNDAMKTTDLQLTAYIYEGDSLEYPVF